MEAVREGWLTRPEAELVFMPLKKAVLAAHHQSQRGAPVMVPGLPQ